MMTMDSSLATTDAILSNKTNNSLVIAMVAGEASGDTLGADLIQELQRRYPSAKFVGIGGPKMQALGFESWYPMEMLSVMGFFEVLKSLRTLLKLRKELISRLIELNPDVFIGVDAPDFNFTVERKLKEVSIPAIHYVGPSIWAWREKRLVKIKKSVSGVLVLFPFEPDYYHRYDIPVAYVGHPLARSRVKQLNRIAALQSIGLPKGVNATAVLVGSRMSEIQQMTPVYMKVVAKLQSQFPKMHFVFPAVHAKAKEFILASKQEFARDANIKIVLGNAAQVLEASSQALVTSGTASLECGLYELPMVISIKVHPISFAIMKRMATTKWFGLPNILAQKPLVVECIQGEANVANIYSHMLDIIQNDQLRSRQISEFQSQYQSLNIEAAKLASDAIQNWAKLPAPANPT